GTSLGGGTLWGLLSLLTDAKSYDEMLDLSKDGDNRNVDMLVGDIYGGDYSKVGLKASTIASSFGKVFKASPADRKNFKQEDISRSLLYLVSNNIGQIAYLNAQAHGVQRIYFSGFFIRGHAVTMNTLNYAINFWSKGKIKALFLRHEGYLGVQPMGAFLRNATPRRRSISFQVLENFSQVERISGTSPSAVGAIEVMSNIRAFPLLRDVQTYTPETTDLASDPRLQHYWLDLLDKNLSDLVTMVVEWQLKEDGRKNGSEEALKARAVSFESMYRNHLQRLRREPNAYGVLTIRSLLNLREQCLREMGFTDVFEGVKKKENAAAMPMFFELVKEIDLLPEDEQIKALTDNVLAGIVQEKENFVLSTTIQEMLKKGQLGFDLAKEKVQHPAKFNHLSRLQKRLLSPPPYRKAIVFVDNSGADAILGILPFVRYLVKKGTRVILAANTRPAVNDITAYELDGVLSEVAKQDGLLAEAVKKSWIKVVGTGSGEPCLDLRRVSEQIASEATDTDLVILEGMGRAIHTNFFAKFRVDCLKIAVFKNPQVAEQLGAQMYDGIRIFEQV
ncbi:fumble-domain-containing protein, partial [Zopfochytrium polystomum]